ncbi:T9SS type A sorting domain-containing protein [Paenimyroides viscosum]|uniref:T9SS C-terminal target domain-containing protein n=1 Tax=Paenimyroides viscosum TaxID=2488729 RepID=A0A3P1B5L5_9FLAO|nr:T9SS type A sorting domain-containing protein [Paenimyroides viscosum]RRA96249.1 T9SS C-terminal target domain-containing protein [Paenimyroides viscosum]
MYIMSKKIFFFLLIPFLGYSQVQIGQDIIGEAIDDRSGYSVAISPDGTVVAIGAPLNDENGEGSGHVRVYKNVNGLWQKVGNDIDGESSSDTSGFSVSLSSNGNIVAIGAPGNSGNGQSSGHVRIFENISGVWTQIGNDIDGEASLDTSGFSVSISLNGNIVAIGAPFNDGNGSDSGHVRVYENISGSWTKVGNDIDGEHNSDGSGSSISISADGDVVAIGAPRNDGSGLSSGHVRVYQNISGNWIQIGNDINGKSALDNFGVSVSLSSDGNILASSASLQNGMDYVRVYQNVSGNWLQIGNDILGENLYDWHGKSVSLSSDGTVLAVGAPLNIGNGIDCGHVRIFKNLAGVWTQILYDIDGKSAGDFFGWSVSLSADGNTVAIGSTRSDIDGSGEGYVRVFDLTKLASNNEFVSQNFNIYPNPTSDILNISLENNLVLEHVTIYNNLGQVVKTATENVIDVSHLAKGLYFVEVTTNQGKATKKVVVQ